MLQIFKPRAELQAFISKILLAHYQLDWTKPKPTNPIPPQPEHSIFFYPFDKVMRHCHSGSSAELPRSLVVGPKTNKVDLTMGYNTLVIIVNLQPGGLHRLLRIPMSEIFNQSIDASLFYGSEIEIVLDRINDAKNYQGMIRAIETFFLNKTKSTKRALPIEKLLTALIHQDADLNIDQMSKQAFVSNRQLERQFKERIGLAPKVYARLNRFSRAWTMKENNPAISWLEIAHACAYADQMHMIRDFKDFTGATPGALQAEIEKSRLRLQHISTE